MTDMYAADDYAAIAARMKAIKVESDPDTGLKPLCDLPCSSGCYPIGDL